MAGPDIYEGRVGSQNLVPMALSVNHSSEQLEALQDLYVNNQVHSQLTHPLMVGHYAMTIFIATAPLTIRLRRVFVDREDELQISQFLGWVLTPIQEQRTQAVTLRLL